MRTIKIGLVDDNHDFCKLLQDFFVTQPQIQVVFIAHNGMDAIKSISENKIDVLLLDLIMPQLDGYGVLEWIKSKSLKVKSIVFSAFAQEDAARKAVALGADYYILKPFNLGVLSKRIADIAVDQANSVISNKKPINNLENEVSFILQKLKIPIHYKGYNYLREAVLLTIKDPNLINEVTKKLYPLIAQQYKTEANSVERSMRIAIEAAWNKGDIETMNKLFGYCIDDRKGKPTNASFIAILADKIRLEQRQKGK